MPDEKPPEYRVDNPDEAFARLQNGVRQALTVSKPEILKREREAKEQRKQHRKHP